MDLKKKGTEFLGDTVFPGVHQCPTIFQSPLCSEAFLQPSSLVCSPVVAGQDKQDLYTEINKRCLEKLQQGQLNGEMYHVHG